jgi:predicted transposase YdaD
MRTKIKKPETNFKKLIVLGPTPWDSFHRVTMRTEGVPCSLILEKLPAGNLANLLPETARLVTEFITDPGLRQKFMDILIEVQTKSGETRLALVIGEHKSYPDKWVALQLAGYMQRLNEWWHSQECNRGKLLPNVYLIVVYSGKEKWQGNRSFAELWTPLTEAESLLPIQRRMDFEYTLIDLGATSDDELSSNKDLRAGWLALKYALRPEEQAAAMPRIAKAIAESPSLAAYIHALLLRYEGCSRELIYEELAKVASKQRRGIMSIADELLAEGRSLGRTEGWTEGRTDGLSEGRAGILTHMLRHRFGDIPPSIHRRIERATEPRIKEWSIRVLEAQTIEDVFASTRRRVARLSTRSR